MIGIRVDANKMIATGHVMRCIAIANGFKKAGLQCVFISSDRITKEIVHSYGFKVIHINSKWNDLSRETKQLSKILEIYKIEKLLIDSYYITYNYLEGLMNYAKVIYIDDLNLFYYPVSMIINYNIYYEIFMYSEKYKGSNTQLLLGCKFAPLREEFQSIEPVFRMKVKRVLITTGGTDEYNATGALLSRVIRESSFIGIEFHVVVGQLNSNYQFLNQTFTELNNVKLHYDVKNMSELMLQSDIAITAGGSTIYELCACGIPSISFSFADNQIHGVKGFEDEGIIAYAGDIRDNKEKCITELINYLILFLGDVTARRSSSLKMKNKVDGKGVDRIVEMIINM